MKKFLLAVLASVLAIVSADAQCVTNVNFNGWQQGGQPGNGNWVLQNGGTQVHQTVNGAPTFFYSPFDLMNVHISGSFKSTDFDDDWMGFVFSFLNPLGATDSFDCWLYDWKQEYQNSSPRGMSLNRCYGLIPGSQYGTTFESHLNTPEFTVVQNNFGSSGWSWNTNHGFDLYLTYSRATIYIDGALKFDVQDCFKPGRFGFYNLSQKDCYYSNFQYSLYVDYFTPRPACTGTAVDFEFINPCVNNISQYASATWNYGDGTSQVINNPTLANVNGSHAYNTAGIYTATLTVVDNNGCSASASHTVDIRVPITLASSLTAPLCNGASNGSVTVTPSGGFGNYQYTWSNATTQQTLVGATAGTYTVSVTDGICNASAQYTLNQPTAVTATTAHTDAPCGSNGTATLTVSGGTPPYSGVNWAGFPATSGVPLSMPSGTWIADFHDANGCSALLQYRETIAALPCGVTTNLVKTDVTCFGGSNGTATLTVTGGSGGSVSGGWTAAGNVFTITGLALGTYNYNYTDANPALNFTFTVTITQPGAAMVAQLSTVPVTCSSSNNGQALASVLSGGITPYSYTWSGGQPNSPTANNLAPGPISVTVTDSRGCTATASGTVSGIPSLTSNLTTTIDSCFHSGKGSVIASTSGGTAPYNYVWNNSNQDSANLNVISGTYNVTITDNNGCSITRSAVVGGPTTSLSNSFVVQNVACYGNSTGSFNVTAAGGTPGYTYAWTPNSLSGTSQSNLAAGVYSFTITDANGCKSYGIDTVMQADTPLVVTLTHTDITCNGAGNGSLTLNVSGGNDPFLYQGNPIPAGTTTLNNLPVGTYGGTLIDSLGCGITVSQTIIEPAVLSITQTHVNVLCNGASTGSITTTPAGGTAPYTFAWNDGVLTQNRTNIPVGNYTVTLTDVNLCSASVSVSITQPTAVGVTEVHTNVLCNGGSTGSITTTPSGGTAPYTFAWNDGVLTQNRTNIPVGNYSVTVSDVNLCSASVSVSITQPTAVGVTEIHTNVLCNGGSTGSITTTPSGGTTPYTFAWNDGVLTQNRTNIPIGNYSVTVSDVNLCSASVSISITQPTALVVTTSHTNSTCFGANNGTLTINVSGGTAPYNYGGIPVPPGTTTIPNLPDSTYSGNIADASGCSVAVSETITEPAAVVMNVTPTDAACFGGNGSATATPVGGAAPFTYIWSNGGSGQTIALPAGNYSVSATDAIACQQTASFVINQPTQIAIQETHTNVSCFGGANGDITLTVSGGTGPGYTYTWLPNVSAGITATALIAGTYNVTVTDQANCTNDTFVVISQPLSPVSATVQAQDISCFGANDGKITVTAAGGSAGYTYIWSPSVSVSNIATGLVAGNYSITVNDVNSCSTTASGTITEPAQLVLTPSQTDLTCFQINTGTASVTQTGGTPAFTYTWSPNVSSSNNATALAAGVYNLTVTDNSSCTATVSFTLTQPTQLVVAETHSNVKCFGDNNGSIVLTASGATPAYTYQWSPNVSSNDSALNLTAGNYSFTVTDNNTCSTSQTVIITSPVQIVITAVADSANCFGESTGAITTTVAGGTSPYSFVWNDAVATQNRVNIPAGNYSVTVTDNNSCSASVSTTVYEPILLAANADSVDVSCYHYTNGQIIATATGGAPNYTYSLSTGAQNNTGLFTNLSVGSYSVTVTDANNCTVSDAAAVNEPNPVIITATPDVVKLNLGETVQLQTSTNQTGILTYNWLPTSGLSCYDCPNPAFSGNNSVVYTVVVVNDLGCSGNATVNVTVVPEYDVFIPNAFTPNGDGTNDTWTIFGNLTGIKQLEIMVFNRWGEKVFESNDIHFEWDGRYKGEFAPNGVYVYAAKFVWLNNHADKDYKGTVTLLK